MFRFPGFPALLFLLRQALIHGQFFLQTVGSLQCLLACRLQLFQFPFPPQKIAGVLEGTAVMEPPALKSSPSSVTIRREYLNFLARAMA